MKEPRASLVQRAMARIRGKFDPYENIIFQGAATEIILGMAIQNPARAGIMAQAITNAIENRNESLEQRLNGISWIVPGNPKTVKWQQFLKTDNDGQDVDIYVAYESNGQDTIALTGDSIIIDKSLIPSAIFHSLEGRKITEIVDLPFLRSSFPIKKNWISHSYFEHEAIKAASGYYDAYPIIEGLLMSDIENKTGHISFNVFKDRRSYREIIAALNGIAKLT